MGNKRNNIEDFMAQYMDAVANGLTRAEFAARIGILPATVYQRVYELRRQGVDVPQLRGESRRTTAERAKAAIAKFVQSHTADAEEVDAGEEEDNPLAELLG